MADNRDELSSSLSSPERDDRVMIVGNHHETTESSSKEVSSSSSQQRATERVDEIHPHGDESPTTLVRTTKQAPYIHVGPYQIGKPIDHAKQGYRVIPHEEQHEERVTRENWGKRMIHESSGDSVPNSPIIESRSSYTPPQSPRQTQKNDPLPQSPQRETDPEISPSCGSTRATQRNRLCIGSWGPEAHDGSLNVSLRSTQISSIKSEQEDDSENGSEESIELFSLRLEPDATKGENENGVAVSDGLHETLNFNRSVRWDEISISNSLIPSRKVLTDPLDRQISLTDRESSFHSSQSESSDRSSIEPIYGSGRKIEEDKIVKPERWVHCIAFIVFLCITVGFSCVVLVVFGAANQTERVVHVDTLQSQLEYLSESKKVFDYSMSPQFLALAWLKSNPDEVLNDKVRRESRYALAVLYYATGGDRMWEDSLNFLSADHECNWFNEDNAGQGVECDVNQKLTHLAVVSNGLKGHLPRELSALSDLVVLDLSDNDLTGNIPELRYSSLQELNLGMNQMEGTLPFSLTKLVSLKTLDLSCNSFLSTLPTFLADLSNLEQLKIGGNNFDGPIDIAESLFRMRELNMTKNAFTGAMDFLTNFAYLEVLDVSFNNLVGTVPLSLGDLIKLQSVSFSNNQIFGQLPSNLGHLSNLQYLDGSNNMLTGTFPWSFSPGANSMVELVMADNLLSGSIPLGIVESENLELIDFRNNNLSGKLPSGIVGMAKLKELFLSMNILTGDLPADLGFNKDIITFDLEGNLFTGSIPSTLGSLSHLRLLLLSHNHLTGNVPDELRNLSQIERISLQNNRLNGTIEFLCTMNPLPLVSADCGGNLSNISCSCCECSFIAV